MRYAIQGRSKFTGHPMELRIDARDMGEALERGRRLGLTEVRASTTPSAIHTLYWHKQVHKDAAA